MIPKRLKEARKRAKLTQEKLAVMAGIDEATAYSRMSHYENGTHRPSFETVCAFAKVLNVPECYFYAVDDSLLKPYLSFIISIKHCGIFLEKANKKTASRLRLNKIKISYNFY